MRLLVLIVSASAAFALAASCDKPPAPVAAPASSPPPRLIPPLWDAKVGEWLRIEDGPGAVLYRVVGAGDVWVDVETTTYQDQLPVGAPHRERWTRNSFGLPAEECVIRAIDPDRIEAGGKQYDCWRLFVATASLERMFWISDQVSVHGLLKVANVHKGVVDEAHAAKLADFGFSEEKK